MKILYSLTLTDLILMSRNFISKIDLLSEAIYGHKKYTHF